MMASRDFKLVVLLITFVPIMGKPMEKRNQDSDCCPTNRFMVEGDRDFLPERRIYEDESNDYAEPCASIGCAKKRGGGPVQFDLLDYMHGMKQRAGGVHSTVTGLKNPVTVWTWEKGMHPVE